MKIALLISGYLRTFNSNIVSLQNNLLNENENIDIYIHLTKNEVENDKRYLNKIDIDDIINSINKELKPKCLLVEEDLTIDNDIKINNVLNQWFKYYKLNTIKTLNEKTTNQQYDLVIKYRPDLNLYEKFNCYNIEFNKNLIYIPYDSKIDKSKLIKPNDHYICDIFAYGTSENMNKYLSLYEYILDYIDKYGYISENLLYNHLTTKNIPYKQIDIKYDIILSECNIIAICGDSGSGKSTLANKLTHFFYNPFLLECDRYHKWERNNNNWKQFSHLNPEANYIVKMNEDVFNLKIGNNIYSADYDHSNGSFTTQQYIESKDNLIVCGLHTLYNSNNIYNIKIFMDTDNNLKFYWKINRDVKDRGYKLETVLEQMKKRTNDYIKYILPQKSQCDIIINFYTDKVVTINNVFEIDNLNIYLKVKIKNSKKFGHNINEIIKLFRFNHIPLDVKLEENFIVLDFKKYIFDEKIMEKIKPYCKTINKNFYDYIIYIINKLNN